VGGLAGWRVRRSSVDGSTTPTIRTNNEMAMGCTANENGYGNGIGHGIGIGMRWELGVVGLLGSRSGHGNGNGTGCCFCWLVAVAIAAP